MTPKSLREVFQEFWRNIEGTNVYPIKERNRQIDNLIFDIERIIVPKTFKWKKIVKGDKRNDFNWGYETAIEDIKARIRK